MRQGIPYGCALDFLDASYNEPYFAGAQDIGFMTLRGKHPDAIHQMRLADGLGDDLVTLAQCTLLDADQ